MVRRLAEATKACRARRTRGEMVLRFFLVLVKADVFFFFAGARFAGVVVVAADVDDLDWEVASGKKPSLGRKKIPAKTTTAKRRTQTLPTAESWHPGWKDRLLRDFLLFHVESNCRERPPCSRKVSRTSHGFSRSLLSIGRRDLCFSGLLRPCLACTDCPRRTAGGQNAGPCGESPDARARSRGRARARALRRTLTRTSARTLARTLARYPHDQPAAVRPAQAPFQQPQTELRRSRSGLRRSRLRRSSPEPQLRSERLTPRLRPQRMTPLLPWRDPK